MLYSHAAVAILCYVTLITERDVVVARSSWVRDALGEAAEDGGDEGIYDLRFTIYELAGPRVLLGEIVAFGVVA